MQGLRVRMGVVAVLCCVILVNRVGADGADGNGGYGLLPQRGVCLEPCTFSTPGACCVEGERFGAVELETRAAILTGNDVVWRIEQEMLRLSFFQQQLSNSRQQFVPSAVPAELAETVHFLAARALLWLCGLNLKLARFSTHEVVGTSAKALYNTLKKLVLLLMHLVRWSTDEIAGIHSSPPTVDGYGPCGGRWPCQQMVTCAGVGCSGGYPRQSTPVAYAPSFSAPQPPPRGQPQYAPYRPYLPGIQTPASVSAKQKQGAIDGYGAPPRNGLFETDPFDQQWLRQQQLNQNRDQSATDDFASLLSKEQAKLDKKPSSKNNNQANNDQNLEDVTFHFLRK